MRRINFPVILWLFLMLIGQINCSAFTQQNKTVKFGETITLQPDETVKTEDGKLTIQLTGVGREISESGETEYVELTIRFNRSEQKMIISEREETAAKTAGNYVIKLINAESFGKNHCQLEISRKVQRSGKRLTRRQLRLGKLQTERFLFHAFFMKYSEMFSQHIYQYESQKTVELRFILINGENFR